MANSSKVSLPVIKRLPRYYRYVSSMKKNGASTISSSELASVMGTTASQVRQDFNCFGGFGQQGIGYNIDVLMHELERLLFQGTALDTILIGTGKLGRAVSNFLANEAPGYHFTAAFDASDAEIGTSVGGLTVRDIATLRSFCEENQPQIAVLCIPAESAKSVAALLIELGIKGFWNFSHYDLTSVRSDIVVENVHLADSLFSLGYRVRNAR